MHTLISGGCKNGKSYYAQRVAKAAGAPLYYLATMISTGAEDDARIARHLKEREGWGFETIECGKHILNALEHADANGSFLLDSVTALLANEMFGANLDEGAPNRAAGALLEVSRQAAHLVCVCDDLFRDAGRYDSWTECYRRGLAQICRRLAREFDLVCEVTAGIVKAHKGAELLGQLLSP